MKEEKLQISLAAARVNAHMTQGDVATALNVSRQTIVNWENGKVVPGIPQICALCQLYNIEQDYIFLPSYSTKSR